MGRCRDVYNAAPAERKTAWERHQMSVTYYQQKAELPDLKAACPEYCEVNAQVLQAVILRVERAFQAFFRRLKNGEKPGYPCFQARNRYHSFTCPQDGGGAVLDGSLRSVSESGHIRIQLHRPLQGTPKTVTISREADRGYACISGADVLTEPLPPTSQETGIDVGLKVFLITADGEVVENPRH
jgi:putative transposase